MLIGYARVSILIKICSTRSMPLMKPDAKDIYGKIFGANKKRKQLQEALDYMREGDTLVVWKLSRLTRSLTQVISTVKDLEEWQIGLKVITQKSTHHTGRRALLPHECCFRSVSEQNHRVKTHRPDW